MKPGWQVRPLGEVVKLNYGKAIAREVRGPVGPVPVYGANGIMDYCEDALADGPSIIVGRKGSAGAINVADGPFWASDVSYFTRHDPQKIDFSYLLYFLRQLDLPSLAKGVKPGINRDEVYALPTPLPPLDEQRRIVAVLDDAFEGLSRARANTEANLADARGFFLAALRDTFGNQSTRWETDQVEAPALAPSVFPRARRSRDETQTGGREATLRPIPGPFSLAVLMPGDVARRGWKWTPLTSLARLESGHTPSRKHPEYWGGDVPWLSIKDARDHHAGVILDTLENTNALGIENSSARILPKDTVCLSRTASVGYVTILGRDMATSQDFVNWVCGDALLPEFLAFLLLAQGDDILRFASGSVHQTIYFPEVKAFHICHPPVSVQKDICRSLERIKDESDALIRVQQDKLAHLDTLRQSLLQNAFAGALT